MGGGGGGGLSWDDVVQFFSLCQSLESVGLSKIQIVPLIISR